MNELTDFLLARITEDEELWTMARDGGMVIAVNGRSAIPPQSWIERQVAECEAQRRIAEMALLGDTSPVLDRVNRYLALPYADHPDYRQEWKP